MDDVAATLRWYRDKLGFEARGVPEPAPHVFGIASRDRISIFFQRLAGFRPPDLYRRREGGVWHAHLQTDDVRALYDTLSHDAEVEILEELEHREYGQTEFVVRDPNGYVLVFAQRD